MKKIFIYVLLIGLLASPLMAQVDFGLGVGTQFSGKDYRCAMAGESWVSVPVGWILYLRPGLVYSQKETDVVVVYSGRLHREVPGTFNAGYIEMPVLLVAKPMAWLYFGGGGYGAVATSRRLTYKPLTDVIYETEEPFGVRIACCPPPPPPPPPQPKPIPNGDAITKDYCYDLGFMAVIGVNMNFRHLCPTWSIRSSIELRWSKGLNKVFSTYDRCYKNEAVTASFLLWF